MGTYAMVLKVPVYDTGLGREAGYANDAELVRAGQEQDRMLKELLTPEAHEKLQVEVEVFVSGKS